MICKFKTLGLAMVAVLAMSAFVASAAQAQYTASSYPTTVTAESALGNDVFTTEGGTVECASHFEGTLSEASKSLTITPKYTSCKAFGFAHATITLTGCQYIFHSQNSSSSASTIICPIDAVIHVNAGNCEVQIGAQSPSGSVATSNSGSHVNAQANVTGINYTVTKDGFLCPFGGTGAKTGGTYKQGAAVTLKPVSGGSSISVD